MGLLLPAPSLYGIFYHIHLFVLMRKYFLLDFELYEKSMVAPKKLSYSNPIGLMSFPEF